MHFKQILNKHTLLSTGFWAYHKANPLRLAHQAHVPGLSTTSSPPLTTRNCLVCDEIFVMNSENVMNVHHM
jgi:hypothetical protein